MVDLLRGPGQATQNLLMGNLEGAQKAILQPEALTPEERDALLKKLHLNEGPFAPVFRTLTNPAVILSAAMAIKFPVPGADDIFKFSDELVGYTSKLPWLHKLQSIWTTFRGTPIPDNYSGIVTSVADFRNKHGASMQSILQEFQKKTGRLPSVRDEVLVGLWLDGAHVARTIGKGKKAVTKTIAPGLEDAMDPALKDMARSMKKVYEDVYEDVLGDEKKRARVLRALGRGDRLGGADLSTGEASLLASIGSKPEWYLPHKVMKDDADFAALVSRLTQGSRESVYARKASARANKIASDSTRKRVGYMLPDQAQLSLVEDVLDPTAVAEFRRREKGRLLSGLAKGDPGAPGPWLGEGAVDRLSKLGDLPAIRDGYKNVLTPQEAKAFEAYLSVPGNIPRGYSVRALEVWKNYAHEMAATYGWTSTGHGEKLAQELSKLKVVADEGSATAKVRLAMLENTYIPVALGRGEFKQALKSQLHDSRLLGLAEKLDNPSMKKLLGQDLHKMVVGSLAESRGDFSYMNLGRKASGYLYLSTLGGNASSALKNIFQIVLTTGPTVGFKTAAAGVLSAMKKSQKYFKGRFAEGLGHDHALRAAFPEFAEAGLVNTPFTDEVLNSLLKNSATLGNMEVWGKTAGIKEKISKAMMLMFSFSEQAVRLSTFEAGMVHAKRTKMMADDAVRFAGKLVEQTQFMAGPQNTPYFLLDKNPLTKQFLQFPLRAFEWATETAFTTGSGTQNIGSTFPKLKGKLPSGLLALNPGTFSRAVLGSVIAMEMGREIGWDVDDALLGAAMPWFQESGNVGAPIPMLPPGYQLLGAAALDLADGKVPLSRGSETRRSAPLLVPGGVGAARVVGLVPGGEGAAQAIERSFVDYNHPMPDGTYPYVSGAGHLRGYVSGWDIARMGLGFKGGPADKEAELLHQVVLNRDQIRQARNDYLKALEINDPSGAEGVAAGFKKRFGFDLPVSDEDVKRMQKRRDITRLEQVMQTLPPGPARQQMIQFMGMTLGANAEIFLGMPPENLGQPTLTRDASRKSRGSSQSEGGQSHWQDSMSPASNFNPQAISRSAYPDVNEVNF